MKNIKIEERYLDRSYIGLVKTVTDDKRAGRLSVWIPEFNSREEDEHGWILCDYCSPFAGATNWIKNSNVRTDTFVDTQTSYGMWAVPPDINNEVIVMFPGGDVGKAIWIGCLFKEYMIHEVPGIAASDKNKQLPNRLGDSLPNAGKAIPVAEYNKWDKASSRDRVRPWHESRAKGIGEQGLITDTIRGLTSSSAMRESPSTVFGISTPGPVHPARTSNEQGIGRLGGSTFVMDDGDKDGNDEYIGFRTRSGAYLRIDETNGIIYAINKKGTSWLQMDENGHVDIFGAKSISMRTEQDFNLRADGNINIEAGQNINLKAAKDTTEEYKIVKSGSGIGGDISIHAINDMQSVIEGSLFTTLPFGDVHTFVTIGDVNEQIGKHHNTTVGGNRAQATSGTTGVSSLNYNLSTTGSIDTQGEIIATKAMYAQDFKSSMSSLNNHQHNYEKPQHASGMTSTVFLGGGGGNSSATGPTADKPIKATAIITDTRKNVLKEFDGTTPIKQGITGQGTRNITDYWNRKTEDIETIVARLMTYEPCPAHMPLSVTSSD